MTSFTFREKILAILPVIALAGLVSGSYYLLQINHLEEQTTAPPKKHIQDAFADNFTISSLNSTGITQYRLNATHVKHFEDDSTSAFTAPALRAFSPDQPDVTSLSERGTMNGDQSIIDLYSHARLIRAAGDGDPAMEADSEHFKIYVNDDVIETKKPVKLQHGSSVLYGSGMTYNNANRQIELTGRVHGQIAASETATAAPSE
jgi:lipopolysaccharide export system protein LptC